LSDVLHKIAVAGLAIESSTFSPAQTSEEAFLIQQGMEIMDHYPFLKPKSKNRHRARWFRALRGKSLPGGIVTLEAYESSMKKMLDQLKKITLTMGFFLIYMML